MVPRSHCRVRIVNDSAETMKKKNRKIVFAGSSDADLQLSLYPDHRWLPPMLTYRYLYIQVTAGSPYADLQLRLQLPSYPHQLSPLRGGRYGIAPFRELDQLTFGKLCKYHIFLYLHNFLCSSSRYDMCNFYYLSTLY